MLTNLTLFFMTTILNYENSSTVLYRFSMRIPHYLMGGHMLSHLMAHKFHLSIEAR